MTRDDDFKRLVRGRMSETGERYTVARAALLRQAKEGHMVPVTVDVRVQRMTGEEREEAYAEPHTISVKSLTSAEAMTLESPTAGTPANGRPVLLLKEIDGDRAVAILCGPVEATSIAFAQQGVQTDRPMTHDLLHDVVATMGEAREVRITDLREGTYYAELIVIDGARAERTIPCRPSDGIALAVRADIPILLEESLFTWPPKQDLRL